MKKALSFGVMDFSAVREFVFYKFNVSAQNLLMECVLCEWVWNFQV